jgi:hypothetical protein
MDGRYGKIDIFIFWGPGVMRFTRCVFCFDIVHDTEGKPRHIWGGIEITDS